MGRCAYLAFLVLPAPFPARFPRPDPSLPVLAIFVSFSSSSAWGEAGCSRFRDLVITEAVEGGGDACRRPRLAGAVAVVVLVLVVVLRVVGAITVVGGALCGRWVGGSEWERVGKGGKGWERVEGKGNDGRAEGRGLNT